MFGTDYEQTQWRFVLHGTGALELLKINTKFNYPEIEVSDSLG